MSITIPDISFEYDSGETTSVRLPELLGWRERPYYQGPPMAFCPGWRTMPFTVCVCPVNTESRIDLPEGTYYVKAPDAYLIPCGQFHCITTITGSDPMQSIWCHIRINVFHGLDLLRFYEVPLRFTGTRATAFRRAVLRLNAVDASASPITAAFQTQYYGMKLVKIILDASTLKDTADRELSGYYRIAPILKYMQEHLSRNIELAELATIINLSSSRFSVLFQQITGIAPIAYFNQMRIHRAQELLLNSAFSIGEIAEQLGFFDSYHFSHKFKHLIGISPLTYRRTQEWNSFPGISNRQTK